MKLPASLNIGFKQASGKYLTWTSDDNLYKPEAFSIMSKHLEQNDNIDFVSCDMDWVNEDLTKYAQHSNWCDRNSPITLAYICNIGACFMYKSNLLTKIGEYNEELFCAEDYDYWCRIALECNIAYLTNNLYTYVANTESLSFTQRERVDRTGRLGQYVLKTYYK